MGAVKNKGKGMKKYNDCFDVICNNHDYIIKQIKQVIKDLKLPEVKNKESNINRLSECLEYLKAAKHQGKRMEKRLHHYRDAIESLGFIRKIK